VLGVIAALSASAFPVVADETIPSTGETIGLAARVARFEHGLRPAGRSAEEQPQRWTVTERLKHHKIPGVSIAVLRGGEVVFARAYGTRDAETNEPLDTETVFSVGSLSKTGTALTALRLVAAGKLDLDKNINRSLASWQVPPSEALGDKIVTLRGLLSHTAGLSVHGFADFQPEEPLPTTVQILDGIKPAKNKPIRVVHPPGTTFDYSGGGTTIVQLAIADVTGVPFHKAVHKHLFAPLGLKRMTYESPLPDDYPNVALAHNASGQPTARPRGWESFAENGASGLWANPTEYAQMLAGMLKSYQGGSDTLLPHSLAIDALTEVSPGNFGLGPQLFGSGAMRRMEHGGANASYKAVYEVLIDRGEGVVIFTNGANGGAIRGEILRSLSDVFEWGTYPEIINRPLPSDHSRQLVGTYERQNSKHNLQQPAADDPKTVEIRLEEGELVMEYFPNLSWRKTKQRLLAIDPNLFSLGSPKSRIEFLRGTYDRYAALRWHTGRRSTFYQRK